jgi:hypothetical protein
MTLHQNYNEFINSIIGFIYDIKTESISKSLSKDNRMLHFGILLIIISMFMLPLYK